jgi:hypothetical protein
VPLEGSPATPVINIRNTSNSDGCGNCLALLIILSLLGVFLMWVTGGTLVSLFPANEKNAFPLPS